MTRSPYIPNQALPHTPLWERALIFIVVYGVLLALYAWAEGSGFERFLLETLGSHPAAALIAWLSPELDVHAVGTRIAAPGGGLNIRNGCEGADLLMLLAAGFSAAPLPWRKRLLGLGLGIALALLLNQLRILGLFYAFRMDKSLFDLLHSTVAPIVLIVLIALYFHAWLHRYQTRVATPG